MPWKLDLGLLLINGPHFYMESIYFIEVNEAEPMNIFHFLNFFTGDTNHKSHMQSIIDKLQTPQSFSQSIQELVIALQRTGDPGKLTSIRHDLDQLSSVDVSAGKNQKAV